MRLRFPPALAAAVLTATACTHPSRVAPVAATPDSTRLRSDVTYLASDALEGRGTGTAGNDSAAAYIARRYASLHLRMLAPGFLQPFDARSAALAHQSGGALKTQNVVALLEGSDPALRGEVIVVGAHFDHLGRSTIGALDPEANDAIRN